MALVINTPVKAVFFDLDGTLVDSIPDLAAAVDATLEKLGFAKAGEERVRLWVGQGAQKLILFALSYAQAVPVEQVSEQACQQAHQLFLQFYGRLVHHSRLYAGVITVLQSLKAQALRLVLITNKPKQFLPELLAHLDIAHYFELVLGGDSLAEHKPHPLPLLHAMQALGLTAKECVMVGDSSNDIDAANAAGIASVCVSYGYNHGQSTQLLPASAHIDAIEQLLVLLSVDQ